MQIIENFSAIIAYPRPDKGTIVHFKDGALTITGLGIDDAQTIIKILETTARASKPRELTQVVRVDGDALARHASMHVAPAPEPKPEPAPPEPAPPEPKPAPAPEPEIAHVPKPEPAELAHAESESEPDMSPDDLDRKLAALGVATPASKQKVAQAEPAPAPAQEPKKRGRPPGSTNKPKADAAPAVPLPDPRQIDWTASTEEKAPSKAPKSKGEGPLISITAPPKELCEQRMQLPEVYQFLTGSGKFAGRPSIEREPLIDFPLISSGPRVLSAAEVEALAGEAIQTENSGTCSPELIRRITSSNAFRWMLAHAVEVLEERATSQVKSIATGLRSGSAEFPLLRVVTRAANMMSAQGYFSDYYALASDVGPRD